MTDAFFGVFWIVCLFSLVVGIIGIGTDQYKELNATQKSTAKLIGAVVLIFVIANLGKVAGFWGE